MKVHPLEPRKLLADNAVVLTFLLLSMVAIPLSGYSVGSIFQEMIVRIGRNSFLVLALLIPIFSGMGLNFGMVLGAMAGQIGLIFAVDLNVQGVQGLLFAALLGLPLSVLLGWMTGWVMNKAKGREMVTGYILAFFMSGVYQFFVLYMMGSVIPIQSQNILLSRGYGIRNTLDLDKTGLRLALDKFLEIQIGGITFPLANFLVILAFCLVLIWFKKTKLGQDMRAVGSDMSVAAAAGIPVERTRTLAIVISTVLACFGQIIFLQNMGNMATYNAHDQTGFFAVAAILVGGASVKRANIRNVFLGILLLHLMYYVSPPAGKNLFGDAQVGEYFRSFMGYGAIALSLVLYAMKSRRDAEVARSSLRQGTVVPGGKS